MNEVRFPASFAVQLVQRLRDLDPKVRPILAWLDQRLSLEGTTADDIVAKEHHEQGTANVSVRNVVTSMRLISAFDWQEFVESVSLVDEVLRQDGNFGEKDFVTRDSYRHSIEDLARGSIHSELDIAERAARHVASGASETGRWHRSGLRTADGKRLLFNFKRPLRV